MPCRLIELINGKLVYGNSEGFYFFIHEFLCLEFPVVYPGTMSPV
jgi:hypothetical protein